MTTSQENDPLVLFNQWYEEAEKSGIEEPEAVNLATATRDGKPSNRMVLLKDYDHNGFVFYTNLESRKGSELLTNPFAAMCFYWQEIDRQVRIEGEVSPVSEKEADEYFKSRPLLSKIGASLSQQSRPIESNFDLLKAVTKKSIELTGKGIARPKFWSGFRLVPNRIEFWQRGDFRIHKRTLYSLNGKEWLLTFLYP